MWSEDLCSFTILAEIGPDVRAFLTDRDLASLDWLCPESYESADIKKSLDTSHTKEIDISQAGL